jgi:hypothetical protein
LEIGLPLMKWESLTVSQKAERVRKYAADGLTALQIANLMGAPGRVAVNAFASRNAIILKHGRGGRRSKKPRPGFIPDPSPVKSIGVAFLDRQRNQCAYIINDDLKHAVCCGNPVEAGSRFSYCEAHYAVMFSTREGKYLERSGS